ncbi:MAG: hypothetical protein KJO07_11270, partial [Deltaproteobacteria bacterium]|nr:hypothetical protein [Deltaproteobacteria bacterium]
SSTAPLSRRGFKLRKLAFVDAKELKDAMIVDGAVQDKLMMSLGDEIYLRYGANYKPKVGNRYSIYEEVDKVVHPRTGKNIGAYVRIRGEVEIKSVKRDRRARAVILRSSKPIERGQKVGPIKKVFKNVEPVRNERNAQGYIVGKIDKGELIGARQLVLIDLGRKAGIKEGNRLFIIRRGDAYPDLTDPGRSVGQDDKRFPARALGEVVIVDVGESISLALVTLVVREVGVGDMVLMRKDTK